MKWKMFLIFIHMGGSSTVKIYSKFQNSKLIPQFKIWIIPNLSEMARFEISIIVMSQFDFDTSLNIIIVCNQGWVSEQLMFIQQSQERYCCLVKKYFFGAKKLYRFYKITLRNNKKNLKLHFMTIMTCDCYVAKWFTAVYALMNQACD